MNGVQLLTIHHSGDGKPFFGESIPDVARHLEIVRQFHRQRGFDDIGYHFAIDRAGRVWQLRSLNYRGQHVRIGAGHKVWNDHNMGIVLLGDFNLQPLPESQKNKLLAFIPYARKRYALQPSAVHLHGEIVDTDCPGKQLSTLLQQVRKSRSL
jgi:N-acetyl-anhydromuramyl-L-alanine amidase AmpD